MTATDVSRKQLVQSRQPTLARQQAFSVKVPHDFALAILASAKS
jgi:hypothetical protein